MIKPIDSNLESLQCPDKKLVLKTDEKIQARLSLWWENTPLYDGKKVGYIGHFEAVDQQSVKKILQDACSYLKRYQCEVVIGPMDGNTWFSYRWITEKGQDPLFLTEPKHPDVYPKYFESFGFLPVAKYNSTLASVETKSRTQPIKGADITVKLLDLENFEHYLMDLYHLSSACFKDNFLYSPISYETFCQLYHPLKPLLSPEFVLFAYKDNKMIGFVLCIPDLSQKQAGKKVDQVILKTLAVHPDYRNLKLGSYLVSQIHKTALEQGYKKIIHAFMHEQNVSQKISQHYGKKIREYTLYKLDIT